MRFRKKIHNIHYRTIQDNVFKNEPERKEIVNLEELKILAEEYRTSGDRYWQREWKVSVADIFMISQFEVDDLINGLYKHLIKDRSDISRIRRRLKKIKFDYETSMKKHKFGKTNQDLYRELKKKFDKSYNMK